MNFNSAGKADGTSWAEDIAAYDTSSDAMEESFADNIDALNASAQDGETSKDDVDACGEDDTREADESFIDVDDVRDKFNGGRQKNYYCSICRAEVDDERADILTVSALGNPRYLCEQCSSLLDTVAHGESYDEIEAAFDSLGKRMEESLVEDELVIDAIGEIFGSAKARAEEIKAGTYDFALDEDGEDAVEEEIIPEEEEPAETEEERLAREKKEKIGKIVDLISSCFFGAVIVGFLVYFIVKLFF